LSTVPGRKIWGNDGISVMKNFDRKASNQIKIFSDQLIAMRKEETISICCKSAMELNSELQY